MRKKVIFRAVPFLLTIVVIVMLQELLLNGPYRISIPGKPPAGTTGIVSVLALISAVHAFVSGFKSDRIFLHFSMTLLPSLVVLHAGLQAILAQLGPAGHYLLQGILMVLGIFVVAGISRMARTSTTLGMDRALHGVVFSIVHVAGACVGLANLIP